MNIESKAQVYKNVQIGLRIPYRLLKYEMMKTAAPLTSPVQPSKTNKKVINEMISELK